MFRKTGIGLAALAMMAPGLASALGVGDYTLNSYLNQPLEMEVELFDAADLEPEEVLINLGSEADFQRAGVERVFFLNDLNFEVTLKPNGTGTLRIVSSQPVREPFLNFIVEIMWPTGRLLREYTVLLDPPSMAEPARQQDVAPVTTTQTAPASQPAPVSAPQAEVRVIASSAPIADTRRGPDYVVQASDTMWRIASNHRPSSSVSVQQMLVAIQQLNPDAFIDGNVNLVREGTVLRMPSEEELRRISTREALVEVAEQNRQWRARLEARGIPVPTRPQLDGTGTGQRGSGGAAVTEGQVTLVAPDASSGSGSGRGAGGTGGADASVLQNELAIRDENVDRLNRQNRELESRLRDLQDQVATSEQLLKLRNDQIAQLQQQLNELRAAQGLAPAEQVVVEPVQEAPVAPTQSEVVEVADAEEEGATAEEVAASEEGSTEEAAEPVVATEPVETAPVRPVAPQPAPQPSLVDTIMTNLHFIVGGIAVLVLLIGGMIWARNRQKAAHEEAGFEHDDDDQLVEGDDDFFAAADADDQEEGEDEAAASEPAQDPLEEVDVYTAYGRHAEAVTFLRNEIHKAPQRDDLKVRLLEVLADMNDRDGFERQATAFAGAGASVAAAVTSLRARLGGAEAEPSLDDLEMDLNSAFDAPAAKAPAPAKEEELELDLGADEGFDSLDFSLDEDKPAKAAATDDVVTLSLDDEGDGALSLEDDGLSLDLDDSTEELLLDSGAAEPDELSLELDEADDTLSLSLDDQAPAKASVALDDINSDLSGDEEFGEISLEDMSDEFEETAVQPSSEELDLSLDELTLDESEEPTQVSMPAVEPQATVQRDALSLEEELSLGEDTATAARPAVEPALEAALGADDDDFDFLGDTDENATKLDLAKAYIDMGDAEGARDILQEVMSEGNPQQQQEAKQLLAQVG